MTISYHRFRPEGAPNNGVWAGAMENGKTGLFEAIDMAPHIELRVDSPNRPGRNKISRRGTSDQSSQFVRNSLEIFERIVINMC